MKKILSAGGIGGKISFLSVVFLLILVPIIVSGDQKNVFLSELFPNPKGSDKGKEFVEIYNDGSENASLEDWTIKKTSTKGKIKIYKFKADDEIKSKEYFVIKTSGLNNDGATVELFDGEGVLVNKVKYDKVVEGQSYNFTKQEDEWYWAEVSKGEKNISQNGGEGGEGNDEGSDEDGDGEDNNDDLTGKTYSKIIISELLPNPSGEEKVKEFIELYNPNKEDVNLTGWQLRDASKTGHYDIMNNIIIPPKGFWVVERGECGFALNNSGSETVKLIAPNDKIVDEASYQGSKEDFSYSYNFQKQKWFWTKLLTPGKQNKFNHPPTFQINLPTEIYQGEKNEFKIFNLQDKDNDKIRITWDFGDHKKVGGENVFYIYDKIGNYTVTVIADDGTEQIKKQKKVTVIQKPLPKIKIISLLPNPEGADTGREKIGLQNLDEEQVDLIDYKIATGSREDRIVKHKISQNFIIQPGQIKTILNQDICKFVLTNSTGIVRLLSPDDRLIDEVKYDKKSIAPNQEYILGDNDVWQWAVIENNSGDNINQNDINNHLPTFKIKKSKKVYKNVWANFVLKDLKDKDGDKIKIVWDFGDGHRSYLKKTKHKYSKTGKYTVKVKVRDGHGTVEKEFKIKVKKYPKYKLKIVGLLPNPDGRDRGKEFIAIKNNSKKKINLRDYKIFTGRNKKKLVGHPFYKSFIIKAGEIKKLFNGKINKFSLLNKSGLVELVYPNGKVADKIKYGKSKILPNEEYFLSANKKWQWRGGTTSKLIVNLTNKVDNFSSFNEKTQVLGVKNTKKELDITLNKQKQMCNTLQQIKIDNWRNKTIFKKYHLLVLFPIQSIDKF